MDSGVVGIEGWKQVSCKHERIVLVDTIGRKIDEYRNEVDFVVKCDICYEEFLRTSRKESEIVNLTIF